MDGHVAREQVAGVEAAQRLHAQEALIVDEAHQKADLVHVGADHHAFAAVLLLAAAAVAGGDHVAHRVHAHVVGQPVQLGQHEVAHGVLLSGHAGEVREVHQDI